MQYQDYDYETETDAAWTTTPTPTYTQMVPAPRATQVIPTPVNQPVTVNAPPAASVSEMYVLGTMIQSMQQAQTQQIYYLRDMDARLARLENNPRSVVPTVAPVPSFERATWWAIWGLLMLILGGALAVVLLLILLNMFR